MVSFAPSKVHVFEVLCHVWVEPMVLVAISLSFLLLLFFSRWNLLETAASTLEKLNQRLLAAIYTHIYFICVCVYFSFFSSSFTIVLVLVIKALHKHRYSIYKWVRLEEKIRRVTNCRQKTNCRLVLNGTYSFSKEKQDRCPFIMEGNRCNIEFQKKKIYSILSTVAKAQFITVLTIEGWTWGMQSLIYILLCLFVRVCFALK